MPRIKITSFFNEINFYLQERGGGTRQPRISARGDVFLLPFWPTCANRHTSVDREDCALSTDVWRLAWVGQYDRRNQLVMASLLCHGESGSCMFCGCIVWLSDNTQDVEHNAPTTPKPSQLFPPTGDGDQMSSHKHQRHVNKELKQARVHMSLARGGS